MIADDGKQAGKGGFRIRVPGLSWEVEIVLLRQ